MAEARPAGKHQAAGAPNDGNALSRASASVTQTTDTDLSILLFNVSGTNTAKGMSEAQKEGIKRVLNRKELALDKFSTFIFCSDGITHPKKQVFNEKLQTSSPTRNKNAAIFYNKTAQTKFSPEYVHDVPMLPLHLEHWKQKQEAREHIKAVKNYVTEWTGKKQTVGAQDKLEDAQQLCQEAMSLLDISPLRDPSYKSTQGFRDACLGRVAVTLTQCLHSDTQRGLRILLASWHGPHTGIARDKRQEYFQRIIRFIEELRKHYQTHFVVLGGDFNLNSDQAMVSIVKLKSQQPNLPDIKLFSYSSEKLMYTVVWPVGYLELRPGFPQIIPLVPPTVQIKDLRWPLTPFDHTVFLYRFAVKLPET